MIGSHCLICNKEVQEFEKFRIIENGIIHSVCARKPGAAGEGIRGTTAFVQKEEQGNGRR